MSGMVEFYLYSYLQHELLVKLVRDLSGVLGRTLKTWSVYRACVIICIQGAIVVQDRKILNYHLYESSQSLARSRQHYSTTEFYRPKASKILIGNCLPSCQLHLIYSLVGFCRNKRSTACTSCIAWGPLGAWFSECRRRQQSLHPLRADVCISWAVWGMLHVLT